MAKKSITRREFLKAAAVAPLAGAAGCRCPCGETAPRPGFVPPALTGKDRRARVVLVRDAAAVGEGRAFNAEVIQKMLDDALAALFGESKAADAWKLIVRPEDTVGIKTNVWNFLPTGKEVEAAVKRRVMEAGVPESRIGLRDRGVLNDPVFQAATVLINARPARTHHWSGLGSCIKNYIMFVPKPSAYHGDSCADLAAIWSLPAVKGRTKLNINVMLTPLFNTVGPQGFSEQYLWSYKGILVGTDPVAVDSTALRIIEAKRKDHFGDDRPMATPAHHIKLADTRHGLGTSDPDKIELVKLGWTDGILI